MIDLKYTNDDGDEVILTLPSKKEVCPECDGEGYVLCEGMRGYAYSSEEFRESFPEYEDRQEYFKRGGIYDQSCPTCHSKNVIDVVDENQIPENKKDEYAAYLEYAKEMAQADAYDRAERDAERRFGC